ncbi:uroporphyrinogen-III synthase [Gorillibacterium sp. sgz5001074]|uniref:uroporphyrinogen-III synthase n=1 Tax=Gorillibacterium sp. sgz5001074 TaxID=3446695 RepID=UPI003F667C42
MERGRLEGKRIAVTGPRKTEELGRMLEKQGGIPLARPAQGTVFLDDAEARSELVWLLGADWDWFIFTTGVGLETMLEMARQSGAEEHFLSKLRSARVAARGYKAIGALKKLGVEPEVRDPDGTSAGLVRAFEEAGISLGGQRVALQLHGDPAPTLVGMLKRHGAEYREILPYRHIPPAAEDLDRLIREIVQGEIDAVMFTSGAQVRFPFAYARQTGRERELLDAFAGRTVAVAVGKYTAEVLREEGVGRVVVPEEERMGFMVQELARYYAEAAQG